MRNPMDSDQMGLMFHLAPNAREASRCPVGNQPAPRRPTSHGGGCFSPDFTRVVGSLRLRGFYSTPAAWLYRICPFRHDEIYVVQL